MRKKSIQKMAFVDPYGKNVKHVKDFIYKIIDELLKKVSNAEKFPPLPKKKKIFDPKKKLRSIQKKKRRLKKRK